MDDRKKVTEFSDEELLKICVAVIDAALEEVPMPDDVAEIASAAVGELFRRGIIATPFH
ncbi:MULTISPECIES: hypothetical protein [Ensifer]|jgi:hypothetical protein|uniref:hypothetical protein n=1 Tax=Ensifer TaxID=106591 RepID=UPI000AD495E4|nr:MULTISPECIES: hypothetical protein [Ensifer]